MLASEFDCLAGVCMSFNAEVNDIDQVTKQVKISIPPETFSKEFNTGIVELMKTSKVNGFRAGKAPRQIVERLHGERIKFEVANRLISKTLFDTIRERSIDMIGDPDIDVPSIEPGKELNFTAQISVFPKPEIEGYETVAVEVQKREVTDADVDALVDKLRESKATTKKIENRTTAQEGDVIDASLTVKLESETEPSRPEPLQIQIGKQMLPPELDSGIVGMNLGELKVIEGKVPDSHRDEELRGKPATYTVTLNAISEKVLAEFDDAFVESLGREAKTVSALRAELTKQLESENKKAIDNDAQVAILDKLTEKNSFLVPQVLIDQEIRSLLVRFGMANPQQVDVDKIDVTRFREGLGDIATKRVRGSIIVDRIVEKEKLEATAEEFDKWCTDFAVENKHGVEDVKRYFSSKERLGQQMAEIAREKGLDFLRSKAKITLVDKVEEAPSEAGAGDSAEKKEKKPKKKKAE
jgi:trigger factor